MYVVPNANAKLTAKAKQVVEICKNGGYVRYALEKNVFGREQFETRVYDSNNKVVKGLGYKSAYLAIAKGLLIPRECFYGSAAAQEWGIK